MRRRVLPGLPLAFAITLLYTAVIMILPLTVLIFKTASLGFTEYWQVISSKRVLVSYRFSMSVAFAATLFNAFFGLILAWVLTRYQFPGRRLLNAIVDLPFALPTSVAGLALTKLFVNNGLFGEAFASFGLKVAYTPLGVFVAMAFTSLPFVVRTVQPVLEDLDPTLEEAGMTLGGGSTVIFTRIIFPLIAPALLKGTSLSFARSLGEFGAIIFIAGNKPMYTEIMTLLIFVRLEEYDYQSAAALASMMLFTTFIILMITNVVQAYMLRYVRKA